jgi:ribosomal protein S18 acetylase RimI-like enzyme
VNTRFLDASDLDALLELATLGEAEGFLFVRRFVDDLIGGRVKLADPCEFFLGAFVGDQLIGIGGVTADPYIQDPDIGRLRHLYVRSEFRGSGIGRALVAQLEARARRCYAQLRLRTDTVVAARFYEGLGYEVVPDASATHRRVLRAGVIPGRNR